MSDPTPAPVVRDMEPVSLAELEFDASLLTRKDRKYLVPRMMLELVLDDLRDGARVLEIGGARTFGYESVYFDTPDLVTYMAAARRRPMRFKVRTRSYVDSRESLLELKTRDRRGLTVKHRLPYRFDERSVLTAEAMEFLGRHEQTARVADRLGRTLTTRYMRTTLLETASSSRITIDTDMECIDVTGERFSCPDIAIVETKTSGGPCQVDHLLWAAHLRPVKVSKYCTSLAALHPELPSNKWRPVLRSHFDMSRAADVALRIA